MTKHVLFLCTGNYYRSRFAEILFNELAAAAGLDWRAESRGLATELGTRNVGPISVYAIRGLAQRGISFSPNGRYPLQAEESDLADAEMIIAMKEAEHRPFLVERFPAWDGRVSYWHIDDVEYARPDEALAEIEKEVRKLLTEISAGERRYGENDNRPPTE